MLPFWRKAWRAAPFCFTLIRALAAFRRHQAALATMAGGVKLIAQKLAEEHQRQAVGRPSAASGGLPRPAVTAPPSTKGYVAKACLSRQPYSPYTLFEVPSEMREEPRIKELLQLRKEQYAELLPILGRLLETDSRLCAEVLPQQEWSELRSKETEEHHPGTMTNKMRLPENSAMLHLWRRAQASTRSPAPRSDRRVPT